METCYKILAHGKCDNPEVIAWKSDTTSVTIWRCEEHPVKNEGWYPSNCTPDNFTPTRRRRPLP